MMYPQQQQDTTGMDPIKMARRWRKFLKQEEAKEKKEVKKETQKPWSFGEVVFFCSVLGPLLGTVYMYAILAMVTHMADMVKH